MRMHRRFVPLAIGMLLLGAPIARAEGPAAPRNTEAKLPTPAEVTTLAPHPPQVRLIGGDDSAQLIITGTLPAGAPQDLSGAVQYAVADPNIARVTSTGRVIPLANGTTAITARYGDRTAQVALKVEAMDTDLPINFPNQVVPVFTKLGCNSGGCHGKSGGQNGFALSLLGFVPEFDYQTMVKEDRGRRLLPSSPDSSLVLLKASGQMAHGGGKRMEPTSDEYKMVRRWIASGMPYGADSDPVVTKITVYPEQRIISRQNRQQFAVYAHYSDGRVQDVTQRAQYESNDPDIAVVDGTALVRSLDLSGEAAIMARYLGQVATFRATVPLGLKIPDYEFEPRTVVDVAAKKKWQQLGIVPSALSSDEQFVRRVYVDITGTLPTSAQLKAFLADKRADKRDRLIDALLDTPEYGYYFANRWADVLRVKRGNNNQSGRIYATFAFHDWIRRSIAADKPYDEFVREILGAVGDESKSPPTMWFRDLQKPEQFVDDACQLFLGVRMACAQCHHHPYEKWGQDDYWGMAAFFGSVGRKTLPLPGLNPQNQQQNRLVIYHKPGGSVINKRTQQPAIMKALDGPAVALTGGEDPRQVLVSWMVDAKNPFFARAVANRYWAHFMGKGIVDPVDDMRVTNPPSNPELLDALAKELVEHNYNLKHLIRVICKSRTYQLSSMPNEFNKSDKKSFARYYPHRMSAEVLFDAVSQVTGAPGNFAGLPTDKHAPNRAIMLPDEAFPSYFLDVFGRPQRISACECERVSEANLAQVLHLLNSQEIQGKLSRPGARADQLAKDARPDAEKIEELFLAALARRPTQLQLDMALSHIQQQPGNRRQAYENIIWALVNTKEFILVQ
jgi:hypothetical protein